METPEQKCLRLLGALEDLAQAENASLLAGDAEGLAALQDRAAPLVAYLAEHGAAVTSEATRRRVAAWLEHRRQTESFFAGHIARMQERMREIDAARRRVARLAPAYSAGVSEERGKFVAVG